MTAVCVLLSIILGDGNSWSFVGTDSLGVMVSIPSLYFGGPGLISFCPWCSYFSKSFSRYIEASYAFPALLQMFECRLNKDNIGKSTIVKIWMFCAFNIGKVVIDAFRLINPNMMVLGQEPRQTTSNLGHLQKPSVQVVFLNSWLVYDVSLSVWGCNYLSHFEWCDDSIFNKWVESFSFKGHLLEIVEMKNAAKL